MTGQPTSLTPATAAQFMALTGSHLGQQYPYKMDLVLAGPEDCRPPISHNPIFHGSFDWHSCVHGWWQVLRLARLYPDLSEAAAVRARADAMLVADKVAGEVAWFNRPHGAAASRPYGWAWLLALHGEATLHDGAPWATALEPLARLLSQRLAAYLTTMTYPIRVGTHFNSSFAMVLARDWALRWDAPLVALIDVRAVAWFGADQACQAWEPGGDEFLSSALTEALLMSRVLPAPAFADWFSAFLPQTGQRQPATLFTPADVSDRSDGKIAHLDGLNLSRAWCWRAIARALGPEHPWAATMRAAAEVHLTAGLPHVAGDYMGEHWLASYALLALTAV